MSLDVNITKLLFPKTNKINCHIFWFHNIPQPPLLIKCHQDLMRYQFPDLVIPYHVHSNASILKYFSNIQHLLLDVVERKETPKVILHMLKLRTSSPMKWNTLFWEGTWQLDHSHNEHNLYTNLLHFTKSFKTQIGFIPIIMILNTSMKPWTNIPAKELHLKLHPTNATSMPLTKSIDLSLVGHSIWVFWSIFSPRKPNFNPPFKMEKTKF